MQKSLWEIYPNKGLCLPAFTWAGRMGMARIYHTKVVLLNWSRSSDCRHSFSDRKHFCFAFPLLFPGAAQDVPLWSQAVSLGGRAASAWPAQLSWMCQDWCGLTRHEQLAVLWSALKPSSDRFWRGFSLGCLVIHQPFVQSPVVKD